MESFSSTDLNLASQDCEITIQGYLRRTGKVGRTIGLRHRRFYKLDGSVLSKHLNEKEDASWHVNVKGSSIVSAGKQSFAITLSATESNIQHEFDQNRLILHARTETEVRAWIRALEIAANRKLESFYTVGPVIGEGGFARVHRGQCKSTGELRAIKTMKKVDEYSTLFGREIAIIKRVDHPNIVKTYDVFETEKEIHIVMEYMKGGMLYEAIEDGTRFLEVDTVQLMRELVDGILYLHRMGIVHRDIKPENVLCTSKNTPLQVKIADFGLSSINGIKEIQSNNMLMSTMIGTPEFVAPEIARREPYTEKVDMWALGMLCYNLIAGKLPLDESKDMLSQLRYGITLTFPEPEWNNYSPQSKSFVRALLCTKPESRLCPLACLVHPWIEESSLASKSKRFAANGRVSNFLYATTVLRSKNLAKPRKSIFELRTDEARDWKFLWKMAYIGVAALNRLTSFITPVKNDCMYTFPLVLDTPKSYHSSTDSLHDEGTKVTSIARQPASTEKFNAFTKEDMNISEFMKITLNEVDNNLSTNGAWTELLTKEKVSSSETIPTLSNIHGSTDIKLVRVHDDPDEGEQTRRRTLSMRGLPFRRNNIRQKLSAAFSTQEPSSQKHLLRKLSWRKPKQPSELNTDEKCSEDLDMSLECFGTITVDDGDLVQLERLEEAYGVQSLPAAGFKSKKKRELSRKALRILKRIPSTSPVSPKASTPFAVDDDNI